MVMKLVTESDIRSLIDPREALDAVREALVALARGKVTMPAPLELDFPHQHADLHVKGAFLDGLPYFAFKVVARLPRQQQAQTTGDLRRLTALEADRSPWGGSGS
jgi:ornithine cyclodeaminase/alanine dehydrogenase-like protein (mu-crystallin family)